MTWIKFCGTTNLEDALKAVSLGIDALGFIFAPSPRKVEPDAAKKIILSLPETFLKVGAFVNEEAKEVQRVADYCGLTALQFHGKESSEYCRGFSLPVYKAIHVKNLESLTEMEKYQDVSILLDTYSPVQAGGTGNPFPWEIAIAAREKRNVILSGGLNPSNVREAIEKVRPLGVDVCSGIERVPGRKDPAKMIDFVEEVRKADEPTG